MRHWSEKSSAWQAPNRRGGSPDERQDSSHRCEKALQWPRPIAKLSVLLILYRGRGKKHSIEREGEKEEKERRESTETPEWLVYHIRLDNERV